MSFLLDTCFLSELVKAKPNPGVASWLATQDETQLFLSVISLGEIQAGVSKMPEGPRKLAFHSWLHQGLPQRFAGRVLDLDVASALLWGRLKGESSAQGVSLPVPDGMLAATATTHGFTVITRNTRDLLRCGAHCLNPWSI